MRKIRFRGWAHASNIMFYPCMREGWELKDGYINPTPNTTLMQFTGLTDKNGKDIYEGDIISFWGGQIIESEDGHLVYESLPNKKHKRCENSVREVVFERSSFRVSCGNPLLSAHLGSSEVEVIGNIHENPELLQ